MTTADVAKLLGVTTVTVTKYARAGLLQVVLPVRPFLFDGNEVSRFRREVFPLLLPGRPRKGKKAKVKVGL